MSENIRIGFDLLRIKEMNRLNLPYGAIEDDQTLRTWAHLMPALRGYFSKYFGPYMQDILGSQDKDVRFLRAGDAGMTIATLDRAYWQRRRGETDEEKEDFYVELSGIDENHPIVKDIKNLKASLECYDS